MRILIVEDDRETAAYLKSKLESLGHAASTAANGRDGLLMAAEPGFDVVVLDRMLPELDGLGLVTRLRRAGVATPVLFLTNLSGIDDRVEGLEGGGAGYLEKHIAWAEVLRTPLGT